MSADEYKAEGNKYFAAKDFEKAIEAFSKAIDASETPNHVLYSNRSGLYASLKNFAKALEDAELCVKINPSWAKGYNRVGAAQYGLSNLEESKTAYSKALELDSNNAMAKQGLAQVEESIQYKKLQPDMGLGRIFNDPNLISKLKSNPKTADMMKDPELVQKVLNLQLNPQANAMSFLSDQRMMTIMATLMGVDLDMPDVSAPGTSEPKDVEMEDAKSEGASTSTSTSTPTSTADQSNSKPAAESAKSTTPTTSASTSKESPVEAPVDDVVVDDVADSKAEADAFKAEGNTLYKQRKFDEAIAKYDAAWEAHKDITYLNNRAAAEFEKGDYDAAIKTCELAIDEGRSMRADYVVVAKSFARLGNSYLKKNDLQAAVKYFDKSLTEHRTPDVLNKLRATQKEIKVQEAKSYIDPEKAEEARLEGKEYFTKGDWPNAVKAYTEMVKRAPEDARGYSNRAAALAKLMSFPDAVRDCDLAIEKDPTFIRAYIRKANAQLAMKEYNQCMETLTGAREKDSELGGKNLSEIDQLYNKTLNLRFQSIEGETPEQTMERVSRDPEIVQILQDPIMQGILGQAKENPAALQEHMKNPDVNKKINMLIAAGVIRTR